MYRMGKLVTRIMLSSSLNEKISKIEFTSGVYSIRKII